MTFKTAFIYLLSISSTSLAASSSKEVVLRASQPPSSSCSHDLDVIPLGPNNVKESRTHDLVLINREAGNKPVDDKVLHEAVGKYFRSSGLGDVLNLETNKVVLLSSKPLLFFTAASSSGHNLVLRYNYVTREIQVVLKEKSDSIYNLRKLEVQQNRYLVAKLDGMEGSSHLFYDIEKSQSFELATPQRSDLRISGDGKYVLQSSRAKKQNIYDDDIYENVFTTLDQSSKKQKPVQFTGKIVAVSEDLRRIIIDKSNGNALEPIATYSYPWLVPDLALVQIENGVAKMKALPGWKDVLKRIKSAAKLGVSVSIDGMKGDLTPDGRTLAISLEFSSKRGTKLKGGATYVHTFEQNWIGLWDLTKSSGPTEITSTEMDSPSDQEPNPQILSQQLREMVWRRKFITHLSPSGELTVVRATVSDLTATESEVYIKALVMKAGEHSQSIKEFRTGPVVLDTHGQGGAQWIGVSSLSIDGSRGQIISHITGVGTKVIDLK